MVLTVMGTEVGKTKQPKRHFCPRRHHEFKELMLTTLASQKPLTRMPLGHTSQCNQYTRIQALRSIVPALSLIASFYLVDRGLWHRLPGISFIIVLQCLDHHSQICSQLTEQFLKFLHKHTRTNVYSVSSHVLPGLSSEQCLEKIWHLPRI